MTALSDKDLTRRNLRPDSSQGRIEVQNIEAQGSPQPQASFLDPATGNTVKTDVGWGYDRLKGWEPDPQKYAPELRGLVDEISKKTDTIRSTSNDQIKRTMERGHLILSRLIDLAITSPEDIEKRLEFLWSNQSKYQVHVIKREKNGEISNATDYAEKTFMVLSAAKKITVAMSDDMAGAKLQAEINGWIVLLGDNGKIVTSYPFDPEKITFEERHRAAGDLINEYAIDAETRKILETVFSRP